MRTETAASATLLDEAQAARVALEEQCERQRQDMAVQLEAHRVEIEGRSRKNAEARIAAEARAAELEAALRAAWEVAHEAKADAQRERGKREASARVVRKYLYRAMFFLHLFVFWALDAWR